MKNDNAKTIWKKIKNAKNPICCIDNRFDFDAFCSSLALKYVLKRDFNKNLRLTYTWTKLGDKTDKLMGFLVGFDDIELGVNPNGIDFEKHDVLIFLDSAEESHVSKEGNFKAPTGLFKINIDHHATNPFYGNLNYVRETTSTCSVLYEVFSKNKVKIDKTLANLLLLGLLTDSGFFGFNSVSTEDFKLAATLLEHGAELYKITWAIKYNDNIETLKMMGITYNNLVWEKTKRYAYTTVSRKDLREKKIDISRVSLRPVDLIKRLENVDFVFGVREDIQNPETYNISFRAHESVFDVTPLAEAFDGGGHKAAAGAVLKNTKSIEEAIQKIERKIQEIYKY